jgi:hypothetical protein
MTEAQSGYHGSKLCSVASLITRVAKGTFTLEASRDDLGNAIFAWPMDESPAGSGIRSSIV